MNIFFRVDVSPIIGTGHLSRCLNLAQELSDRGEKCTFIVRDIEDTFARKVISLGFELLILESSQSVIREFKLEEKINEYSYWLKVTQSTDANETIEKIKSHDADWMIIDHYALDVEWEQIVAPHVKQIMVIDDLANRKHLCEILLDHSLTNNLESRYDKLLIKDSVKLLGPNFALLHKDFYNLRSHSKSIKNKLRRIFIYFGGFDNNGLTVQVLKDLENHFPKMLDIDIVFNGSEEDLNYIQTLALENNKIKLHTNLNSLAPLMKEADIAIGAAGITTWERCAVGLPSIVFSVAENQEHIAQEMQKRNFIVYLGKVSEYKETSLINAFSKFYKNPELLNAWSKRCSDFFTTNGVKFVADLLTLDANSNISLRAANLADEAYLLNLRNDPVVRANSINPEPISKTHHNKWYSETLQDNKCLIFIAETDTHLPVGYFRFQLNESRWFISYALNNYARNKNISFKILKKSIDEFFIVVREVNLYAYIKSDNIASLRILTKCGFSEFEKVGNEVILQLEQNIFKS